MNAHGHVTPRPDGVKARCGGPAMCAVCQREQAALSSGQAATAVPITVPETDDPRLLKLFLRRNIEERRRLETLLAASPTQPAREAMAKWDGSYRGKCADGRRCLQGCYSNESCHWESPKLQAANALIDERQRELAKLREWRDHITVGDDLKVLDEINAILAAHDAATEQPRNTPTTS